jgi:hypothetical protein
LDVNGIQKDSRSLGRAVATWGFCARDIGLILKLIFAEACSSAENTGYQAHEDSRNARL